MSYTNINKSSLHFNTNLYTGNNSNTAHTGIGFQPDFVWLKVRNADGAHYLYDAIRGANKDINCNDTTAENTTTQNLMSFDSDGYTVGTSNSVNTNGETMVGWNWKANGQGSANTDGSINTTYTSANTTAGFSIATWTTPSSGTEFTIGHGLGQAPDMMMMKCTTQANSWFVYHKGLGGNVNDYIILNDAAAEASQTKMWGVNGAETNTMGFKAGTSSYTNEPMVGYFFAEKKGYSKFGSYTGNGSTNGPFVYTGFKPAMVIIKKYTANEYWGILDNKRNPYNPVDKYLAPNRSDADNTYTTLDFLSNGFKHRSTGAMFNSSGAGYIYMAFAEAPLVGSNNVPCTAK